MADNSQAVKLVHITTIPVTQWAFLRGQNTYMRQQGLEIHALASPGRFLDQLGKRDKVTQHAIYMSRTISPFRDIVSLWNIFRTLKEIQPHIAVVSTPKAALLGSIAAWNARVPIRIFLFRGSITENARGPMRLLFQKLEWLTARLCHQTICVSPSLLQFTRCSRILKSNEGICVANGMSNGIDASRFDPDRVQDSGELGNALGIPQDAVIIGFVGRLALDKGIHELFRAWQRVREEFPQTHMLLVGRCEAENSISARIRQGLQDDPRVHMTGFVRDVVPYYALIDIFAFPSHGTEGFPNGPMEAAAMRLPVIATRTVGCVDAVEHGVTGTLLPPGDSEALTDAIQMYIRDPDLRRRHGQAGRERVLRDFRPEPIWEALYQEYVRLLKEKGLPMPHPAPESKEEAAISKA